jgi:hypothetical protein
MIASIQGGDSENDLDIPFCFDPGTVAFKPIDLLWGKFNYSIRDAGDEMVAPSRTDTGFIYERLKRTPGVAPAGGALR